MAVYLATGADFLQRTTGLLGASQSRTVMVWANAGTLPSAPNYQLAYGVLDNTPASYTDYVELFMGSVSDVLEVFRLGVSDRLDTPRIGPDIWVHHCWTYTTSTNTHTYYRNGLLIGSFVRDIDPLVIVTEVLGGDSSAIGDYTVAYCRMWNAALTQNQVQGEMWARRALRTSNLWMDTPLTSDLLDISGDGRDWGSSGSISFVDGPDIPTNRHEENALALPSPVPFTTTFDIPSPFPNGVANAVSNFWFKYTAPANSTILPGFWFGAPVAGEYQPQTFVWVGTPGSLTEYLDNSTGFQIGDVASTPENINVPITVPARPGVTYYFQVANQGVPLTASAVLTIDGKPPPTSASPLPVGTIIVSDDVGYFPLAAIDPTTGLVLGYYPFRSDTQTAGSTNESDAILPNGKVLAEDVSQLVLHLYDATLTEETTIPYTWALVFDIVHAVSNRWYVSVGRTLPSGTDVHRFTVSGALDDTWVMPFTSPITIAPSLDETILYFTRHAVPTAPIERWDLVNSVLLSDFAPGIVGETTRRDILVLADGTVVVGYLASATSDGNTIRHYGTNGTLLHTYTFDSSLIINRLALAIENPASFYAWFYVKQAGWPAGHVSRSRFMRVQVSNGAILADTGEIVQFEVGTNQDPASTTPLRFGHSFSCPFWIASTSLPPPPVGPPGPPGPTPGGLEMDPRDIRWLRQTPILSNENRRMLHRALTLDLEAGVGLREGQGVDPLVMLQFSDDSGHTWHNLHPMSIGRRGEWAFRVNWKRLGQSRNRLYRFYGSDPVKICLLDAYTEIEPGDGS
jgi:hypothetical protein